jgi:hypothetical protein
MEKNGIVVYSCPKCPGVDYKREGVLWARGQGPRCANHPGIPVEGRIVAGVQMRHERPQARRLR